MSRHPEAASLVRDKGVEMSRHPDAASLIGELGVEKESSS
jgi:hypothetical protein